MTLNPKPYSVDLCWAEARVKIARMTLTIKLDGNWSSFQLANSAPPLSVPNRAFAPSARMGMSQYQIHVATIFYRSVRLWYRHIVIV